MTRYRHLFLLLLLTLIVAGAAIAWGGWVAIAAQRAQEAREENDRPGEFAKEVGRDLLALLSDIKFRFLIHKLDADISDGPLVLTGRIEGGKLTFDWDTEPVASRSAAFRHSTAAANFSEKIVEAKQADVLKDYEQEIEIYRKLTQISVDVYQREFARLLMAGAELRGGYQSKAIATYRGILALSSEVVDENGYPLALYKDGYAVDALLRQRTTELDRAVLDRMNAEIESLSALARSAAFVEPILRELQKSSDSSIQTAADQARERLQQRVAYLDRMRTNPQVRELQSRFQRQPLGVTMESWVAFELVSSSMHTSAPGNPELWLVGMTQAGEAAPILLAVRAEYVRKQLEAQRKQAIEFITSNTNIVETARRVRPPAVAKVVQLTEKIPNLFAILPLAPYKPPGHRGLPVFFALALAVVGLLAPASLWLVWRDMRRELRLAEMRSVFVSSVSHELKTPLTAIRMFAETMQLRAPGEHKQSQYLDVIVAESERLTRLLNNVLDFSRIERGERTYRMQPAALSEIVESAARTMRFPLASQGFDFRVEVTPDVPLTPVDRDAIEQAVLNLLGNAMKYSGERRDIELRLCRRNGHALIQVVDRGIGIAVEEQKRIFEKFYRAPTPENQAISGTGLGLALVTHIAEAHGGSIEVESAVGSGSTFSIRLPLNAASNGDSAL